MKKTFQKYTAFFVASGMLLTGCTKNFDTINTDPSSYSQSNFDPNYLLTTSQLAYTGSFDFSYDTWRANLIYCSTMMQGFSTVISYWAGDKYLLNADYTAAYWGFGAAQPQGIAGDGAYPEQVRPIVDMIQITKDKPQYKNTYQIARIVKAMIMERISDLYGDVPYFDAGLGYYSKNFFPKYDKQQDIYNDILKELDDATSKLDDAAEMPGGDAFPYKGNIAQWRKFGYSLMLRVAMRLSKVDDATAKTYVQKAVGKTFTGNADNAYVAHDVRGGRPTVNRNSQVLTGDPEKTYVKWSQTMINTLKSTNDPRLNVIGIATGSTAAANQKGMPNGKDLSGIPGRDISTDPSYTTIEAYSSPSPSMVKMDGPTFILTYAETELLWAEAAQKWSIGGDAAQHYRAGLVAAITFLGQYDAAMAINDATAGAYADAHPYSAATGLEMINTQYWIHTNTMLDFYESWSNWRRSGYPALTPVNYPGNVTNATIPRRFPYPLAEANTNPDNYKEAHDAVPGGDVLTSRVWWDKQ